MQEHLPTKRFQRHAEDFVCGNCGITVSGNGYTNHCPKCLYSKHVDIHPGDRAADCGGLMQPIAIEPYKEGWKVLTRCVICKHEKRNKLVPGDDFEALIALQDSANKKRFYGTGGKK